MEPQLFTHIRRYVELNAADAATLLTFVKPVSLKKKELLLSEGQVCPANYFVEKGCLRMYFINEKGNEQTTQFALESWWIADYMSIGAQSPSTFYLQAVEQSEIWAVEKSKEDELLKALPQLERYFRIIQQRAVAASQHRIKYHYDYSREEHYHHFLNLYPEFVQRVPQYMLASYLGFTPEYLSELRKKIR